jgi:hypothetical protein
MYQYAKNINLSLISVGYLLFWQIHLPLTMKVLSQLHLRFTADSEFRCFAPLSQPLP